MEDIILVELGESLEEKSTAFVTESDHHLLEPCRRELGVPPEEAAAYFKRNLHLAFSSECNASTAAFLKHTETLVGISAGYVTTFDHLLMRYKTALDQKSRWPSLAPFLELQLKVLEKAAAELTGDKYWNDILYGDFSLIRPGYSSKGLTYRLRQKGREIAVEKAGQRSAVRFMGFYNSSRGKDIRIARGFLEISKTKYSDFFHDRRNPFQAFGEDYMSLGTTIVVLNSANARL